MQISSIQVFVCHGLAEHLGWSYDDLGSSLCESGHIAFGHDHAGHGMSEGRDGRAVIADFEVLVNDVIFHVTKVQNTKAMTSCIGHAFFSYGKRRIVPRKIPSTHSSL